MAWKESGSGELHIRERRKSHIGLSFSSPQLETIEAGDFRYLYWRTFALALTELPTLPATGWIKK
jgi:hypothetical protein